MRVLIACEYSGRVRDAFRRRGHDAWSCDLLECEADPQWHLQHPVEQILDDGWDLMIAHPPCTYLARSGMHWTTRGLRDPKLTEQALDFVRLLMAAPIPRWCIENPISIISKAIAQPTQIIQPWQFGHGETKATCLWLNNLPRLKPTEIVEGRWKERSRTYLGVASAMAEQWGVGKLPPVMHQLALLNGQR